MNDRGDGTPKGRLIPLGSFESGTHNVVVPAVAFARANAEFDRERAARELAAAKAEAEAPKARLQVVQTALSLINRVELRANQLFCLVGVGLISANSLPASDRLRPRLRSRSRARLPASEYSGP